MSTSEIFAGSVIIHHEKYDNSIIWTFHQIGKKSIFYKGNIKLGDFIIKTFCTWMVL